MPDGVHALMQAMKPSRREASVDCAARNTDAQQLPTRHNAVLLLRKLSQTTINISARNPIRAFATHIVVNARLVPGGAGKIRHVADSAGRLRNGGALTVAEAQRK